MALRDANGRLICSGVLVSPRVVLTAAHCLPLPDGDDSPGPSDVCFGPRSDACSTAVRAAAFETHPAWDPLTFHADLGVVVLEEPARVTPVELPTESDGGIAVGGELEVIGYGRSDAASRASAGERRAGLTRVTELDEDGRVVHGEIACNGDSGGPLFAPSTSHVVAVTSSGPTGCRDFGRATPLAPHASWLAERIATSERTTPTTSCAAAAMRRAPPASAWTITLLATALVLSRRRRAGARAPVATSWR